MFAKILNPDPFCPDPDDHLSNLLLQFPSYKVKSFNATKFLTAARQLMERKIVDKFNIGSK